MKLPAIGYRPPYLGCCRSSYFSYCGASFRAVWVAPAAPPTAAPMMAPFAVEPATLPMIPPATAPPAAPITRPRWAWRAQPASPDPVAARRTTNATARSESVTTTSRSGLSDAVRLSLPGTRRDGGEPSRYKVSCQAPTSIALLLNELQTKMSTSSTFRQLTPGGDAGYQSG